MLIDPIDSVMLIQSLEVQSHPSPITSLPCKTHFRFLLPTHAQHFTNAIHGIQKYISQVMELLFILPLPHNGHTLFCNGNFCSLIKYVLLYAFIHMPEQM